MTHHNDSHDDLQPVIEQLRANRPEASALELDAVKQRVRGRVARHPGRRARSADLMKSRIAILATLVLGMTLSTAGAGLAVSGFTSQSDDAAEQQYNPPRSGGGVLPEQDEGQVAGQQDDSTPPPADLQPTRQVEAGTQDTGGDELPFTGFAAIPVLIGGVALLGAGMALRRRTHDDRS